MAPPLDGRNGSHLRATRAAAVIGPSSSKIFRIWEARPPRFALTGARPPPAHRRWILGAEVPFYPHADEFV
jgi:hypothetical protein